MTLAGSELTTKKNEGVSLSLEERDMLLDEKLSTYRKTAVVEGAGTGAAGIIVRTGRFSASFID